MKINHIFIRKVKIFMKASFVTLFISIVMPFNLLAQAQLQTDFYVSEPEFNRPSILKTEPSSFVQVAKGTRDVPYTLVITGTDLWVEQDPRFIQTHRQSVFLKTREQAGFVEVRDFTLGGTGDRQTITLRFSSRTWLQEVGTLQVMVSRDGKKSAAFNIPILPAPTNAPIIYAIDPVQFPSSTKDEGPANYRFSIRGRYFDAQDKMTLTIGSVNVPIENLEVRGGTLEGVVPLSIRKKPGKYKVILRSSLGSSAPLTLVIRAPKEPPKTLPVPVPVELPKPTPSKTRVGGETTYLQEGK